MAQAISKEAINTFAGGMNMDLDVGSIKSNQYVYAENVRITNSDNSAFGALSPIEHDYLVSDVYFSDETIVAVQTVRDHVIFFSKTGNIYRSIYNNGLLVGKSRIFSANHEFSDNLSTTGRYDDDDTILVYFAEANEPIRVINVSVSADSKNSRIEEKGISALDTILSVNLTKPGISSIGSGRLDAGKIQYCYSLYSSIGIETSISHPSEPVNIFSSSTSGKSSSIIGTDRGDLSGKQTNKSVEITITGIDSVLFSDIKIYSIYYSSSSDLPVIRLIADMPIPGTSMSYIDSGVNYIEEYSVEEFNSIRTFRISAGQIEYKDAPSSSASGSILFAADVNELIPDIEDYDVRAYQFKDSYIGMEALLESRSGGALLVMQQNIDSVPSDHDCINSDIYSKIKYSDVRQKYTLDRKYGGEGPNVKFLFTNTYLIESYCNYRGNGAEGQLSQADRYIDQRIARIGDVERNISSVLMHSSDGSYESVDIKSMGINHHSGHLNYSNPLIANKLASYHRDEIYRFGAVLYDNDGNKSDVKWIADIRFPSNYISYSASAGSTTTNPATWNASSSEAPSEVDNIIYSASSGISLGKQELLVKPMGLKFEFNNIRESISKIEIVRSKRDLSNRTIYAQGVIQKTGTKFTEHLAGGDEMPGADDGAVMPHPVIGMGYSYSIAAPLSHTSWINEASSTYIPHSMFYHADNGNSYSGESVNRDGRTAYNYTDHGLSPYHWNRYIYMLISPEASFYKNDFVKNISDAAGGMSLNVEDIVFPLSTPASVGMSMLSNGRRYFGPTDWSKVGYYNESYPVGWVPASMHFAADITDILLNITTQISDPELAEISSPIQTIGLVGTSKVSTNSIGGNITMSSSITSGVSLDIGGINRRADIYPPDFSSFTEPSVRAFISLGKLIHRKTTSGTAEYEYMNGYGALGSEGREPAGMQSNVNSLGLGSGTFKYFGRYSSITGNKSIQFIRQTGTDIASTSDIYQVSRISDIDKIDIDTAVYSGDIDPGKRIEELGSEYVQIGSSRFINWHKSLLRGDAHIGDGYDTIFTKSAFKARLSGIHGDGIVFNLDNNNSIDSIVSMSIDRKKYRPSNTNADYYGNMYLDGHGTAALSTYLCNMKSMSGSIYGGNGYSDRKFSEYISTGVIMENNNRKATSYVFGGDTYIGIFDYSIIKSTDPMINPDAGIPEATANGQYAQTGHVGAMIPIESSINMRLQSGKSYVTSGNPHIQSNPGIYGPGISAGATFSVTQSTPQFKYNSAYSAERTANVFLTKIDDSKISFDNRVYASDKNTSSSRFDKWAIFKPANYIDVDSKFGSITRLKSFNNRLFFWQDRAFGVLAVNDRSLISDNNLSQLTLGTGEVLSRYDYISTSYGLNKGTVGGLALSDGGIYWFDSKRAEMVVYSSNTGSVSKSQGVQGYMNNMKTSAASKVPIGFDYKYNEVLITVRGPYSPPVVVDPPLTNSYPYLTTEVPEIITNNTNEGIAVQ